MAKNNNYNKSETTIITKDKKINKPKLKGILNPNTSKKKMDYRKRTGFVFDSSKIKSYQPA